MVSNGTTVPIIEDVYTEEEKAKNSKMSEASVEICI